MDDIEAWRQQPLLACIKGAGDWHKALHIIDNLSQHTIRFICALLGMRAVEMSYSSPLAGWLFYRLCLRGLTYPKNASSVGWDCDAIYQASTRPIASVSECGYILYSLHHRIRVIAQLEGSHTPYKTNYCSMVSLVTRPRINLNVDILIWSYA